MHHQATLGCHFLTHYSFHFEIQITFVTLHLALLMLQKLPNFSDRYVFSDGQLHGDENLFNISLIIKLLVSNEAMLCYK
jgi:hypothetical protein